MKKGDWVQTMTGLNNKYDDLIGEIVDIVPQGYYPYGVNLDEHGIVYFSAEELIVRVTEEELPEIQERVRKKIFDRLP